MNRNFNLIGVSLTMPGEVLEVFVTKRRDRKVALPFLKRVMKRYGPPKVIVTDRLRSYRAAMNLIGNAADQECGRWLNNRAENSHQPFRIRERAMSKFRDVKTLQKSVQYTLRSTIISISTAISTVVPSTRRTARQRWPSGVNWRHEPVVFRDIGDWFALD